MKKMTPVLSVDDVPASVSFWVDRLGFESVAEVPGDDGPAFAMLTHGDIEVMVQSWASVDAEPGPLSRPLEPTPTCLFVEVEDLDTVIGDLDGVPVLYEPHETFYGMREVTVEEPGGHVVTFAQKLPQKLPQKSRSRPIDAFAVE